MGSFTRIPNLKDEMLPVLEKALKTNSNTDHFQEWETPVGDFIRFQNMTVLFGLYLDETMQGLPFYEKNKGNAELIHGKIELGLFIPILKTWIAYLEEEQF